MKTEFPQTGDQIDIPGNNDYSLAVGYKSQTLREEEDRLSGQYMLVTKTFIEQYYPALIATDLKRIKQQLRDDSSVNDTVKSYLPDPDDSDDLDGPEWSLFYYLRMGQSLIKSRKVESSRQLFGQYLALDDFEKVQSLEDFFLDGYFLTRINGISIADLGNKGRRKKHSLVDSLLFLTAPQRLWDQLDLENRELDISQILEDNQSLFLPQYPTKARSTVISTHSMVSLLLRFNNIPLSNPDKKNKVVSRIISASDELVEGIDILKETIKEAVINPDDTDEQRVFREEFKRIVRQSSDVNELLINTVLTSFVDSIRTYRRIRELAVDGDIDRDFYHLLDEKIQDFINDRNDASQLPLSASDIEDITSDGLVDRSEEEELDIDWNRFKSVAHQVFQYSSKSEYTVNPQAISDWGYIVPSNEIQILFNKTKPSNFRVSFIWVNNETGENTRLNIVYNCKNQTYDWGCLNSTEEPLFKGVFKLLNRVISTVLEEALNQSKEVKRLRRVLEPAVEPDVPSEGSKPVKQPYRDAVYELRKSTRKASNTGNPMDLANYERIREKKAKAKVKQEISLTELEISLAPFDYREREIIELAIKRFNQQGVGKIKKLTRPGLDGEPRYRVRVNTPGGGVRVLLTLNKGQSGSEFFSITSIDRRADIYRKNLMN